MILEYGRNFSFFIEFLGGSRDNSSFSRNAISVHKLYFESTLSLLELLFQSSSYFYMNLIRNWPQWKKINTFTFGNNTFLLAQIFDMMKIWQNLPIVFQTLKVFMSLALTFKFTTTESLVFPWAFSCDTKKLPFKVNLWRVIGTKIQSFCKIKPSGAIFVGKNFKLGTDRDIQF